MTQTAENSLTIAMDIKKRAERLIRKCNTDNPFAAADFLGIKVTFDSLGGPWGYYLKYCRQQTIVIDCDTPQELHGFICAHELGHARITPDENTVRLKAFTGNPFTANKTERRANAFAVCFLLNETFLREHAGISIYDLAKIRGVPPDYIKLLH